MMRGIPFRSVEPKHIAKGVFALNASFINGGSGGSPTFTKNFPASETQIVAFVSGSAFTGSVGNITVDFKIDGAVFATLIRFANEINSHKTLVPQAAVCAGLGAGLHTVTWTVTAGVADGNDFYNAMILEYPL